MAPKTRRASIATVRLWEREGMALCPSVTYRKDGSPAA
jgi:hypothetical protein